MKLLIAWAGALLAALVLIVAFLGGADGSDGHAPALSGAPADMPVIARGEYLAKAADCVACHTVPGSAKPFAGGVAFDLPFGSIYSPNITADVATGIGRWTDDEFVHAMHDGVRRDGQRLYPAFPYTSYSQMSRHDVLAIKAYLFSLEPISQQSRRAELTFPFDQRWTMAFWNAAFFENRRFAARADRSPAWNRGAYLTGALGHCAECHTPRNVAFALKHRSEWAGATLQGWKAPNISADAEHGVGRWSDQALGDYLATGFSAGHGSASGPMAEVVANSLQFLERQDIDSIVAYLRSLPPRADGPTLAPDSRQRPSATEEAVSLRGQRLFAGACLGCHATNGKRMATPRASLEGSHALADAYGTNVVQAMLKGVHLTIGDDEVSMPAFGIAYSNLEITEIANYVIAQFGGRPGQVTPDMVAKQRKR